MQAHTAFIITQTKVIQQHYGQASKGKQRQARTGTGRADPAGSEQAHGLPYHKNCNLRHNYE